MKQRFFRYIKCRGKNLAGRVGIVARNSFTFVANSLYDKKYEASVPLVSNFIERWAFKDQIEKKTVSLFTSIRYIFKRGKQSLLNHRTRKDMLLGPMWEENFVLLTEILMAPKATKDQKDLYRKITALR